MSWGVHGRWAVGLMLILVLGCRSGGKQGAGKQGEGEGKLPAGKLTYTVPNGWVVQKPSITMRVAQFGLPGVEGKEDGEIAVFFFPGGGGGLEENLQRWYGLFKQPDGSLTETHVQRRQVKIDGLPVTMVYLTGTYLKPKSPMMVGGDVEEIPECALIGAVAETADGPWFFKGTGPQKTIENWRPSFEGFVKSFRTAKAGA